MRVGSLFSGIGGMDAGLARAGHEHVFFCESDPWRREVLRARWPGVPVWDDVRGVGLHGDGELRQRDERQGVAVPESRQRAGDRLAASGVDLLCGGFPCQDLSVAGRRAGLAGSRSGLFHEFARIIDAFRPGWILVENVPGLLSSNGGRDFGIVLGTLADLGYGVAWRVLDSRFFGVPQRRRRVFIVGALIVGDPRAAAGRAGEVLAVGSRCPGHPPTGSQAGQDVAGTLGGGAGERGWAQDVERMTFLPTASATRTAPSADALPAVFVSENQRAELLETPIARQLTGGGGKPGQGYPAIREGMGVRRLTPRECERLQGLPDDWTRLNDKTPDSRRYSALGDAVTANVAEWIGGRLGV